MDHNYNHQNYFSLLKYRQAIHKDVELPDWSCPFLVTLTFKQNLPNGHGGLERLDRHKMRDEVAYLLRRVNQEVYGNASRRQGLRVFSLSVAEYSARQRLHYHILLDCPRPEMRESFPKLVKSLWRNSYRWAYNHVEVEPRGEKGLWYVTKFKTKPDYLDAYDWDNTHLPKHDRFKVIDR